MLYFHMSSPPISQFVTSAALRISLTAAVDVVLIAQLYTTILSHLIPCHNLNSHLTTSVVTSPMAFTRTLNSTAHELRFTSPYPTEVLWVTQE